MLVISTRVTPIFAPHNACFLRFMSLSVLRLSQVAKLVTFQTLEVLLFQENVDAFLDVWNLGHESVLDLRDDLGDKLCVLHRLARLHDADNSRLSILLAYYINVTG
jgi:hypothetical protein